MPEKQSRYHLTSEYQRSALRRAMRVHPSDTSLQRAIMNLSTPRQIRSAIRAGVFINYARADELFAVELSLDLEKIGVTTWLDAFEVSYTPSDWREEVSTGLQSCSLMISILSPASINNEDVQNEQRYFLEMGKLIQPVIYRRNDVTPSPFWLPPIDFSNDYQIGLHQFLHLLEKPTTATQEVAHV